MTTDSAFDVRLSCPRCGNETVLGILLVKPEDGAHQHTIYVCRSWPAGPNRVRCGWSGWTVPGWDTPVGASPT